MFSCKKSRSPSQEGLQASLELLDKAISKTDNEQAKMGLHMGKLQIVSMDKEMQSKLAETAAETFKAIKSEPAAVNQAAWMLVSLMENGELDKDKKVIEVSLAATAEAAKAGEGDTRAAVMDTLAHLQYLSGDLDTAIATQKAAIEMASAQAKGELQGFLDKLNKEKEAKK